MFALDSLGKGMLIDKIVYLASIQVEQDGMQLAGTWPAKIITKYYLFVSLQKESTASSHSQKVTSSLEEYSNRPLKNQQHCITAHSASPSSEVGINDKNHKILK